MNDPRRGPNTYIDRTEYELARNRHAALTAFRATHGRWPRFAHVAVSARTGVARWWCDDTPMRRSERRRLEREGFVASHAVPAGLELVEPRFVGAGEVSGG